MAGPLFVAEYELNPVWNRPAAASGVDKAIGLAAELVKIARGQSGNQNKAIRDTARHCHVSPSEIRKLVQPSRRPKSIDLGVFERIRAGYIGLVRRELDRLEAEVQRVEALGPSADGSREDLAAAAEALAARIRANL